MLPVGEQRCLTICLRSDKLPANCESVKSRFGYGFVTASWPSSTLVIRHDRSTEFLKVTCKSFLSRGASSKSVLYLHVMLKEKLLKHDNGSDFLCVPIV